MRDVVCCQKGRNKVCDRPSFSTVRSKQEGAHASFPEEIKSKFHLKESSVPYLFGIKLPVICGFKKKKITV